MASTAVLLFLSSCATAIIHALIPDHWLPFVLMARSQHWTDRRTTLMVGLAGALHVLVSLALAGIASVLGIDTVREVGRRVGVSLGSMAGILLVIFGVAYGLWAHRREARAHATVGGGGPPARHLHAHGHFLERWFHEALSGGVLVMIIGISPCVLLQPILFAAAAQGVLPFIASALGFALCTLGTMMGVALVAMQGIRRIDLPFFRRYGDLTSGLLIAVIGVFVILQEA